MNKVPKDWRRGFFAGITMEFWLKVATEEQTRAEVDFIQKAVQLFPAARVLDVPCGGGRHSLELAARGYRVSGVDISPRDIEGYGSLNGEPFRLGSARLALTATKKAD